MNRLYDVSRTMVGAALIAMGIPGIANSGSPFEGKPLNVLATVGMVADVAREVVGECAEITTLLGPGTDPHYYQATPRDVRAMQSADLIIYVDRSLEERLADVLAGLAGRTATLGVAQAALDDSALLQDPDQAGELDPHVWMNASHWGLIAPAIAGSVAEQRPTCADEMAANVERYTAELDALHQWIGNAIASIPEGQRYLVTAHDAFYYYADAYGIEASEAVEGISTESEASVADIRKVASFVIDRGVPAVFLETTVNPRNIEAMVAEVRSQGHEVTIGGTLYSDSLGDEGTPEGSFIGMLRANTLTITRALGGEAPPWPPALRSWAESWDITDDAPNNP